MLLRSLILFAALASAVVAARAADWPQWRGPDRDDDPRFDRSSCGQSQPNEF